MSIEKKGANETAEKLRVEKVSTLNFIEDSQAAVYKRVPKKIANGLYLLAAVVIGTFIWSYFATLDESVSANGKIVPSSHVQAIQHLEGGIVKNVLVRVGDRVTKGQVIIILDDTRFSSEYKEASAKLAVLQADIVRLSAKEEGKDKLVFDPAFAAAYPLQVSEAEEFFYRDKAAIDENMALLNKQYMLMKKEQSIISPLAKQGVVSNVELLRLDRQLVGVQQTIDDKKNTERDQAREQLNKAQGEYAILNQTIAQSKDRMNRTVIRSPATGIVNQVNVTTVGAVAKPGDTLIEIVPIENNLTVQAFVRPSDIGFIYVGQKAIVKVSAFDYSIYGDLHAVVETIGADAVKDKSENSFYEVKLRTDKSYLESGNKKLLLIPGMTVTASILTGQKTVLDYILKPIIKAKESALQER